MSGLSHHRTNCHRPRCHSQRRSRAERATSLIGDACLLSLDHDLSGRSPTAQRFGVVSSGVNIIAMPLSLPPLLSSVWSGCDGPVPAHRPWLRQRGTGETRPNYTPCGGGGLHSVMGGSDAASLVVYRVDPGDKDVGEDLKSCWKLLFPRPMIT